MPKVWKISKTKCCKTKVKSNQQSVNQVENNSSNDESDNCHP